jgi:hypothetical protein
VVEVAQGAFLRITFTFGLGFEERPLISCDSSGRLDFVLPFIELWNKLRGQQAQF